MIVCLFVDPGLQGHWDNSSLMEPKGKQADELEFTTRLWEIKDNGDVQGRLKQHLSFWIDVLHAPASQLCNKRPWLFLKGVEFILSLGMRLLCSKNIALCF